MQKKIIALAIAGLASTAAFAQSNVTVYGVADAYVGGVHSGSSAAAGGQSFSVINSGGLAGSRIGFKGTEDLGGGTKALFVIEHALALDSDVAYAAAGSARQQYVGLTGAYGTVIAGRLQSLVYNHNAAYNPTFGTGVDTLASVSSIGTGTAIGTAERLNNAIAYVAPKIGDVTVAGAYTTNAAAADAAFTTATKAYELSASYASGPFAAGAVYRNALNGDMGATVAADTGNNSYAVGASYDMGVAKLTATYGKHQGNKVADQLDKITVYNVGAVVPTSAAGAVILSYANGKADTGALGTAAGNDTRATYAALYKHSLSKRTALYGGFAQSTGADGATGVLAGVTSGANGKVNVALAGINHSF